MPYGIKYQATFDRVDKTGINVAYMLQILEKDYLGSVTDVICSSVSVLQTYQTDDPKAPVKGSSLSINLINKNGSLPLESFYSIGDDQFQVQLFWGAQLMWIGFLVQDDCSEPILDYTHAINLSANDNLGLLKEVALDKAKVKYKFIGTVNNTWSKTAPHTVTLPAVPLTDLVQVGDLLFIHSLITDFTYTITDITANPVFTVAETVTTGITGTSDDISLYRPILFADKITLLQALNNCLAATGLELNTHFFCNFKEINQDLTKAFIEEVLTDPQTYIKDANNYLDCYNVLLWIMARWNLSLFQSKGIWNIVHWDELRYSGYSIPGYEYDSDFNLLGPVTLDNGFTKFLIKPMDPASIPNVYPETGLNHRVIRPFAFDKETFNYKQPGRLLRNSDFQQLGALLNTTTTGSGPTLQTTKEYAAPWWVYDGGFSATFFIRVVTDSLNNEIERSLVVIGNSIHGYKIELNAGDTFRYSFSFKTNPSIGGSATLTFIIYLTDGVSTVYVNNPFSDESKYTWGVTTGLTYTIVAGDNTSAWHTVEITPPAAPFDGLLYIQLDELLPTSPGPGETIYKDLSFEAVFLVNQSTKIIGHTHKTEQTATIKQNEDEEIFLDDSPRNSIAGTLFLDAMSGVLQKRTAQWFLNNPADTRRLGDLTTFETEFWRRKTRSVLEGTLRGLVSADTGGDHISMLSVFLCSIFPNVNYIWGKLEIDYKNNKCTGTLWEIYDEGETDGDLTSTYEFKYLYAPK